MMKNETILKEVSVIDEALAICKPVLGERSRLDGGKRQEGRPARPILF